MDVNSTIINFDITDTCIRKISPTNCGIPIGSKNYFYAGFRFSEQWEGLNQIAVFRSEQIPQICVQIIDSMCQIPNEMLQIAGSVYVSIFAGDMRLTNEASFEVVSGGSICGDPPEPPEPTNVYVQTPGNSTPFIRESFGEFQYFANGQWNTVSAAGNGNQPLNAYRQEFVIPEWQQYLTDVQITIPESMHERGLFGSVLEIMQNTGTYLENVLCTYRRFPNGDISLIANIPFDGQLAIA